MNFDNRTLFIADNLDIMRGMDSETIDLIYLDPPFKSGKQWKAPIGSPAEGAEFKDIWTDEDIEYEGVYRDTKRTNPSCLVGSKANAMGVNIRSIIAT